MLTESLNPSDNFINVGTVEYINIRSQSKPHLGRIFVVFDDGKEFSLLLTVCKNLTEKWKPHPLILAHTLTVYKSQGSTLNCTEGDLGCSVDALSRAGKRKLSLNQSEWILCNAFTL